MPAVQTAATHSIPAGLQPARPDALDRFLSPPGQFSWRSVRHVLAKSNLLRDTAWARNVRSEERRILTNMKSVEALAKAARLWGLADRRQTVDTFRSLTERPVRLPAWEYTTSHQAAWTQLKFDVRILETKAESRIIEAVGEASRKRHLSAAIEQDIERRVTSQLKDLCKEQLRPFHSISEDEIWTVLKPVVMASDRAGEPRKLRE